MKKMFNLLFSALLLFSLMPFAAASAETSEPSKNVNTLISELIYYYGQDARTDVLRTLDLIEEQSPEDYKLWNSVINKWDWIEKDMVENINVAPDGLPQDNTHAFIVLGFALKPDGTMEDELVGRLQVALESAKKYPNSYVLVTGGVMKNGWTEGDRMRDWLLANGLPMERIIVENKSANTVQNASFSYDILYNDYNIKTASIITSQYHLKRASIFYYTMGLLKAKQLGKEPITFLGEGNAGWFRADKTEEPMSLKVSGMSSIAGVPRASNLPISKLEDMTIEGELEYYVGDELNVTVNAHYDSDYVRDVTELADITGFDSSKVGDQELEISYEERGIKLTENITVTVAANKSALETAVGDAEKKVKSDYTGRNWKDFVAALALAKEVLEDAEATQQEVDAALDSLTEATENLVKKPVAGEVDKSALQSAVTDAKTKQATDYTAASWTDFKKSLAAAKAVLANPTSTQAEVDKALDDLNVAISKLEFAFLNSQQAI